MGLRFSLSPVSEVKKAIEKWSPRKCKSEKDFENSLYTHLHKSFDDVQITKQYSVGRTRADLNVGDKVIIEMKKDLKTTAQYDRLIGQIEEYRKWKGRTVILLLGETDPNLKKRLIKHSEKDMMLLMEDPAFFIIEK